MRAGNPKEHDTNKEYHVTTMCSHNLGLGGGPTSSVTKDPYSPVTEDGVMRGALATDECGLLPSPTCVHTQSSNIISRETNKGERGTDF